MPDNDNRLDLSSELEKVSGSFAADLNAAASEVKSRKDADKAREAIQAGKAKSRKISAVVIAAAAVVLLLLSYFIVFGQGGNSDDVASGTTTRVRVPTAASQPPSANPAFVTPKAPQAPPKANSPVGGSSQTVEQPPDGYDQPGDVAPGM